MSSTQHPARDHDPIGQVHSELRRARPDLVELQRTAEALRDDPDRLHASLTALLHDHARLADVAGRSSLHPNGFVKVVMYVGDGYGIRLHVWRGEDRARAEDADPHGHRWEFASWVLTGTLHETTFIEAPGNGRYERRNYSRRANGKPALREARIAGLRKVEEIDRIAGTVYARSRSILHTASPVGSGLVASLVLQRPPVAEPTAVYQRPGKPAVREERLAGSELRDLVADVAAALR